MVTHLDLEGRTWTLDLAVCAPVYLYELGEADPETGEPSSVTPLPGVRLDVDQAAMPESLAAYVVHPAPEQHHFGAGKISLHADSWPDLFDPAARIWRRVEAAEDA